MTRHFDPVGALLFGLLLLAPALWNGSMLLCTDSVFYFRAGESVLHYFAFGSPKSGVNGNVLNSTIANGAIVKDFGSHAAGGISTERSVYYGAPFAMLQLLGSWALVLTQAALTTVAFFLSAARMVGTGWPRRWAAAAALLAGLAMFVSTAMPDLFTGLMILALAMLLPAWPDEREGHETAPSGYEAAFWIAIIIAAVLVHKANLALLAVLTALYVLVTLLQRRRLRRGALLTTILVGAIAAHAMVDVAVTRLSGRAPVATPFLLARLIGDGTATRYLAGHCEAGEFVLCRYRQRLPMTANDFLWSHDPALGVMRAVPTADAEAIGREAGALSLAVIATYPLAQLDVSTRNVLRQLACVGVTEYGYGPTANTPPTPGLGAVLTDYAATPASRGTLRFDAISMVMAATYGVSLLLLACFAWQVWRKPTGPWQATPVTAARQAAIGWILAGVTVNAAISGAISGVFDRYQGRVAWLLPLAALTAFIILNQPRVKPN